MGWDAKISHVVRSSPCMTERRRGSNIASRIELRRLLFAAAAIVVAHSLLASDQPHTASGLRPVLWNEPVDINRRNLFYGPGGEAHQPQGSFTFVKEDLGGSRPKFVVGDEDGTRWKIKLGPRASGLGLGAREN